MILGEDLRRIAYIMHILYQEPKLTADDMRDLAHKMLLSINNAEEVKE
jgi:hypothetical protein